MMDFIKWVLSLSFGNALRLEGFSNLAGLRSKKAPVRWRKRPLLDSPGQFFS